jgi:Na+(H+)/acetate symporter ActP
MKRTSKISVWVSFIFGAGIMLLNMLFRASFPVWLQSPINCGAFAMIVGLIIVPVVSLFTPKPDKSIVDFAFSGYDEKVVVSVKESLGR